MSGDRPIDGWLEERGYGLPQVRSRARQALEEAHLTRPGKVRISEEKLPRAAALLSQAFFLHCSDAPCVARAAESGREPLPASHKGACEACSGSANRRAEEALVEACRRHGVRRLVVVGGSPAVREELQSALGDRLELRLVDGTERRTQERARSDMLWADLVLVWGASELHHKVSRLYTQVPPEQRTRVVHVVRRGVAALLEAALEHLRREPSPTPPP